MRVQLSDETTTRWAHAVTRVPVYATPAGRFWIPERFRVNGDPLYGTRATGTAAYRRTRIGTPLRIR